MIGIIYIGHINRAPFLKKYLTVLDRNNISYDIIYWNRSSSKASLDLSEYKVKDIYEYNLKSDQYKNPISKTFDFKNFGGYAKKIIKNNKYQKLIVLTTMTAMVLRKLLRNDYKNKYIFDYRDASYEYNAIFRNELSKIIKDSYFTCISSQGFKKVLPKDIDYVISHNVPLLNKISIDRERDYKFELPVRVGFIGGIRNLNYMKKIIDTFANDNRFELYIHGGGGNLEKLLLYANGMNNIIITGEYDESKKGDLVQSADILLYNYLESFNNNVALANKYYDGLIYKVPLLGNINTFSGELINKYDIGISLDMDDANFKKELLNYMTNLDYLGFYKKTNELLNKINKDEKYYFYRIEDFLIN